MLFCESVGPQIKTAQERAESRLVGQYRSGGQNKPPAALAEIGRKPPSIGRIRANFGPFGGRFGPRAVEMRPARIDFRPSVADFC